MPIGRGNSDGTGLAMVEIVVVAVASRLPALSGGSYYYHSGYSYRFWYLRYGVLVVEPLILM